jgi:hypothetical protein
MRLQRRCYSSDIRQTALRVQSSKFEDSLTKLDEVGCELRDDGFEGGAGLLDFGFFALVTVESAGAGGAVGFGEDGLLGGGAHDGKFDFDFGNVFGGDAAGDEEALKSLVFEKLTASGFEEGGLVVALEFEDMELDDGGIFFGVRGIGVDFYALEVMGIFGFVGDGVGDNGFGVLSPIGAALFEGATVVTGMDREAGLGCDGGVGLVMSGSVFEGGAAGGDAKENGGEENNQ